MSNIYNYDDKNVWTFVRVENNQTVIGYRETTGWARTRKVYFAMKFSKPFKSYGRKRYEKVEYNGFYRKFNESKLIDFLVDSLYTNTQEIEKI